MICAFCVLRSVNMKNLEFSIKDQDEENQSRVQLVETTLLSLNN